MSKIAYNLFFIPEARGQVRKIRLSERQIRFLLGTVVVSSFFFIFNVVGFWYYRSLYSSLQGERLAVTAFQQEKRDLSHKVAVLEKALGETEKLTGKLASMVGTERVQLQKGVGPISPDRFDPKKKTASLARETSCSLWEPGLDRLEDRVLTLQAKVNELYRVQEDRLNFVMATPSIWPVRGWVTSDFGFRRSPFNLAPDFHEGVDIAAQWGTPIAASADGIVTFAGYRGGLGKLVIVDHGFGLKSYYGHTSAVLVHDGQKIARGMKIARVGSTGHSTGPHLHYEVRMDGVPVDPMKYIIQ